MSQFYTNVQLRGNRIWVRYFDEVGRDVNQWVDDFAPTLYVSTNEQTKYKTIFDKHLKRIPTESLKHAKQMIKDYEGVQGFELFGNTNWEYSYLAQRFGHRLKFDPKKIKCDFIDIETKVGENSKGFPYANTAYEEIQLITHRRDSKYHVFAIKDFDIDQYNDTELDVVKHVFANEDDLLSGYVKFWASDYPHAISGWNSSGFDFAYIINRIRQRHGDDLVKKLSPINSVYLSFEEDNPTQVKTVSIAGIEILDYMDLWKKFIPGQRDSWALDSVAEEMLNERKVENPYDTFAEWYTNDFSHFTYYNIRDVDLVFRLEAKLGLLNQAYSMAYLVGMNYSDVFGTCKPWDIFLQNETALNNTFITVNDPVRYKPRQLMGGYVHLYQAGLYKDGVTLDARSLYPSILMGSNIGPDTLVEYDDLPKELQSYHDVLHIDNFLENGIPKELTDSLKKYNMNMTLNGMFYRNDKQGILAKTVNDVFDQRNTEKSMMINYEKELEAVENEIEELEKLLKEMCNET